MHHTQETTFNSSEPFFGESLPASGFFLAADPKMVQIRELGLRVAATNAPVLIMGESGVGKEVLARFIHAESNRARRTFVKINCAAVPHDLLESELFGHEKGAFTGANQRKEGKFELADGGTILLDEIGEMNLTLQAKLLHVLEDASFARVGGNQQVRMGARIMATTNRTLEDDIAEGTFRKDLYFRLKVIRIHIPSLRERRDDIPIIAAHIFQTCHERTGTAGERLPDRLLEGFLRYDWPGNVREMKHVIERYVILPDVDMVLSELVSGTAPPLTPATTVGNSMTSVREPLFQPDPGDSAETEDTGHVAPDGRIHLKDIAAKAAEEAIKGIVIDVLREERWNRRRAAARLDICYKTLLNKLERWELDERAHHAAAAGRPTPMKGTPRIPSLLDAPRPGRADASRAGRSMGA